MTRLDRVLLKTLGDLGGVAVDPSVGVSVTDVGVRGALLARIRAVPAESGVPLRVALVHTLGRERMRWVRAVRPVGVTEVFRSSGDGTVSVDVVLEMYDADAPRVRDILFEDARATRTR